MRTLLAMGSAVAVLAAGCAVPLDSTGGDGSGGKAAGFGTNVEPGAAQSGRITDCENGGCRNLYIHALLSEYPEDGRPVNITFTLRPGELEHISKMRAV